MPTRITSSMEHPNCVFSVRLIQAMPTDKAVMGICLSISYNHEVRGRLLLKSVNYRGSIISYIHHIQIDHNAPCLSPTILHTSTKLDVNKVLLRPLASFRVEVCVQCRTASNRNVFENRTN